jgi:hypothetical protein
VIGAKGKQGWNREIMEGIPKVVRQRLQAGEEGGDRSRQIHPDAEVLTAFAEHSLAECERAQVFDHVAQCGNCRDILFLAAPQTEAIQILQKVPVRGWWSWPVLRWGALGACVVIVGAVVTLRHDGGKFNASRQEAAPTIIAKEITPAAPQDSIATRADIRVPEQKISEQQKPSEQRDALAKKISSAIEPARHASSAVPKFPMQFDGPVPPVGKPSTSTGALQGDAGNSLASSRVKPLFGARLAKSGNQALTADKAQEQKDELDYLNPDDKKTASANSPRASSETVEVQGASPMVETESSAVSAAVSPSETSQLKVTGRNVADLFPLASSLRWMLTSSGALQRSLDQGHTWERVPVANNVIFHALSVQGAEIWVGGPAGALYHSANSGQSWVQIIPTSNGESLSAEITKIEFIGQQNGTVTTSSGENWVTSDGGKSWQKK